MSEPRLCDIHGPDDAPEPRESEQKPDAKPKPSGATVGATAASLGGEAARYRKAGKEGSDRWRVHAGGEVERLYGEAGAERLRELLAQEDVRVDVDVSVVEA